MSVDVAGDAAGSFPVEPVTCPFTVVIDTREQAPFRFQTFISDSKHKVRISRNPDVYKLRPLYIPTEVSTLKTGDYSIQGFESEICVERKSLSDLYGTLGGGRDRFIRELERMSQMTVAAVVIEANCDYALQNPPRNSKLAPKSVFRSINAWEQDFPHIHFHWMGGKGLAEHKCFRILERFWNKRQEQSPEKAMPDNLPDAM